MKEREETYCAMCRFATEVAGTEDMLCQKKGVVPKEHSCRGFVYDPLKRVPRKLPELVVPEDIAGI